MVKKAEYGEDVLRRLREVREKLGYTQQEMARHIHLKRTTYSSIEQGHNALIERHVYLLRDKLKVNPEYLLKGVGAMFLDVEKSYEEVNECIAEYEQEKNVNLEKEVAALRTEVAVYKEEIEMYKGIIKKILKE